MIPKYRFCTSTLWTMPLFHGIAIGIYLGITCITLYVSDLALEKKHQTAVSIRNCTWVFSQYMPSAWETEWSTKVQSLQNDVCGNTHVEKSRAWIEQRADEVLSHFRFTDSCDSDQSMLIAVEPLVGLTRHPYFCLRGESYLVNKDYMFPAKTLIRTGRRLLFDVGASFYDAGAGGASQKWLVEQYGADQWDGIWSWEMAALDTRDVWRRIPVAMRPIYHWYNIPVDTDGNNPLHFIQTIATRADFVVLKLDIDNSQLENGIIHELLGSTKIIELIDELYFEHHVDVKPMWPYWGRIPGTSLADTYKLFGELRRKGIVAHSWV